jgi:2-keto-4-pentenoate hydratase/2-oxohepta-3-ene-1,7-dioic acid hydratase in catechol pathway
VIAAYALFRVTEGNVKLITFRRHQALGIGATDGRDVIDLTGRFANITRLADLLATDALDLARDFCANAAADFPLADCTLQPVIPNPSKIICLGLNYRGHAAEAGRATPAYPVIFHRHAQTLTAHEAPLLRPRVSDKFDYEGELAVVIGKSGGHISPESAMDYVGGYTCFNESSVRDWQKHSHLYGMGKNFRSTGAMGPWLVTKDEIPDPTQLTLSTSLNGEEVQRASLRDLIFTIPELISYVSKALDWLPGDVLVTGTPSGVGLFRTPPRFLHHSDRVDVTITGIGTLSNPVIDEGSTAHAAAI